MVFKFQNLSDFFGGEEELYFGKQFSKFKKKKQVLHFKGVK